jgi:hypothetical protein
MTTRHSPSGAIFWLGLGTGWAVMVFGVAGVLGDAGRTAPPNFGLWFAGSALVHDLLLAPAVFGVALLLARLVPDRARPAVQAGLVVAAPVVAVALPLILGHGGAPGNPSALPRNYTGGLLVVLAAIAAGTGLVVWRRLRLPRNGRRIAARKS